MYIMRCVFWSTSLGVILRAEAGTCMVGFLEQRWADFAIWVAVFGVAAPVLVYVLKKIRTEPAQQEPTASQLMSKFRDLHSKGHLSDAEFRTIKTQLAARIIEELKDNGETG